MHTSGEHVERSASAPRPADLDDLDRRIVGALRDDARLSVRALAERVHVSRAAAHARLQRLERDGVIVGYGAQVDPDRLGLSVSAFVQLRIAQHAWKDVRHRLRAITEIWSAALVSGDHDLILLVRTRDAHDLRGLVLDQLQAIPGVLGTQTVLILDEVHDAPAGRTAPRDR